MMFEETFALPSLAPRRLVVANRRERQESSQSTKKHCGIRRAFFHEQSQHNTTRK